MVQRKWLALCGIVAAVLIPLSIIVISGNTPNEHASAAKVISFYRAHETANKLAAVLVLLAAVLLVLFAAQLRTVLQGDQPGAGVLTLAAWSGLLLTGSTAAVAAAIHLALVNAAHYRLAAPAQSLNVLDNYIFVAIVGGIAVFGLATGFATLQRPVLPRWLGWAAIVFGVLALLGPIGVLGLLLALIWIIVVGIMIFRKDFSAATN